MFFCLLIFKVVFVIGLFLISLSSITKLILVTSGIESILFIFLLIFLGILVVIYFIYVSDIAKRLLSNYKKNKRYIYIYIFTLLITLISKLLEIYYLA